MAMMEAESLAQHFFEWWDAYDGKNDTLLDAILIWLFEEAGQATRGDHELYLKTVAVIIHEWHSSKLRMAEMPNFESSMYGWRCIEKETYERYLGPCGSP